MQEGFIISTTC